MRRRLRVISVALLVLLASECAVTQTQTSKNPPAPPSTSTGTYRVGGAVSPPRAISSPEPLYSNEALKEGVEGVCVLWLVVDPEGKPRDIRVQKTLGYGLDEKAIEAVRQWRFEPARKNGTPVAVQINVEVTFRIPGGVYGLMKDLERRANAGDAKAELDLSEKYLRGEYVNKDEREGYRLLKQAADHGLPKAQFQMGEYTASHGDRPGDYIVAYMWYAIAERKHYKHSDQKMKELASKMSPEDVTEAQKRAASWQPSK